MLLPALFMGQRYAGTKSTRLLVGLVVGSIILVAQFFLFRIMDRFAADPLADARIPFARNTWEALQRIFPSVRELARSFPSTQPLKRRKIYYAMPTPTTLIMIGFRWPWRGGFRLWC